ncbi:MAG TPA: hypothetical protein VGK19_01470 [Capsulimonadaceae bacterium]|jgi:hypothetical protein
MQNPFPRLAALARDADARKLASSPNLLTSYKAADIVVGIILGYMGYELQLTVAWKVVEDILGAMDPFLAAIVVAVTSIVVLIECYALGRKYTLLGRSSFYTVFVWSVLTVNFAPYGMR